MANRATRRAKKQKLKERYAKVREDAQLAGIIATEPSGGVRDERVNPALQGSAILPGLVKEALRNNWATPDCAKPAIVASLLEPFFQERELDANGKPVPPDRRTLVELAKVLRILDQTQFERDHPEEAGVAKGGASIVMQATQIMRENLVVDPATEAERAMALTQQAFGVSPEDDRTETR